MIPEAGKCQNLRKLIDCASILIQQSFCYFHLSIFTMDVLDDDDISLEGVILHPGADQQMQLALV